MPILKQGFRTNPEIHEPVYVFQKRDLTPVIIGLTIRAPRAFRPPYFCQIVEARALLTRTFS
jgi:hypothetical protein